MEELIRMQQVQMADPWLVPFLWLELEPWPLDQVSLDQHPWLGLLLMQLQHLTLQH